MGHIYSPKHYYRRVKVFLREFDNSKIDTPIDLQRFLAFFRSSIRLGILGKERFHYWYLMTWTLVRKPRLLPLAITLAIYSHHFRSDMREPYSLRRVANFLLNLADNWRKQIRIYHE